MKIFYYVHTGHRIGLDRFRRAATIIRALDDVDITLLCSDFRIAQVARDFGISKSVGIDVVRNIAQIAHHGDQLIFDSEEANPIMLEDMRQYFSTFIRVSDDPNDTKSPDELMISPYLEGEGICKAYAVGEEFFHHEPKKIEISFFFGDDDYEKDLEKNLAFIEGLNAELQLGFYYFLDYEDLLKKKFRKYHEFEGYEAMIKKTDILITASPQAVLESLASGGRPIYLQRADYTRNFNELFESFGVPIVESLDLSQIASIINTIDSKNYYKIEHHGKKISKFIKENLIL
ncbi:MAG TPA: hypothetical protein CFH84_11940 [Sulfurimonas sp. UBA12504]|nr:MAG: hypothetical protein A2019_09195 [Sulfurimonas sp. GWF2_37_8]DAB29002.1 MAG TPA: hypothetical protein CFH84_11940 [Sulfurimonas sp. UBA12504]